MEQAKKQVVIDKQTLVPIGVVGVIVSLLVGGMLWLSDVQSLAAMASSGVQQNKQQSELIRQELKEDIQKLSDITKGQINELKEEVHGLAQESKKQNEHFQKSNTEKLKLLYKQQADMQVIIKTMEMIQNKIEKKGF